MYLKNIIIKGWLRKFIVGKAIIVLVIIILKLNELDEMVMGEHPSYVPFFEFIYFWSHKGIGEPISRWEELQSLLANDESLSLWRRQELGVSNGM